MAQDLPQTRDDQFKPPPRYRNKSGGLIRLAVMGVLLAGGIWAYASFGAHSPGLTPVADTSGQEQQLADAGNLPPEPIPQAAPAQTPAPVAAPAPAPVRHSAPRNVTPSEPTPAPTSNFQPAPIAPAPSVTPPIATPIPDPATPPNQG